MLLAYDILYTSSGERLKRVSFPTHSTLTTEQRENCYCKHHVWQPKKLQAKAIRTPTGKFPRHRRDGNRSGRIAGQERPKTRPVRRTRFKKHVRHLISFRNLDTAPTESIFIQRDGLSDVLSTRSLFIGADGPAEIIMITSFYCIFQIDIMCFIEAGECYRIVCPTYNKEECI